MAARRGKSQARRSGGNTAGLPGWAWMVIGIVIALLAVLVLPRYFKAEGDSPFFRPQPNPDAQPAISAIDEDLPPPPASRAAEQPATAAPTTPSQPEYDFYTMLPEQEVAMSDAQLAATAREEAERQRRVAQQREAQQASNPDAAEVARPAALPETATTPRTQPAQPAPAPTTVAATATPAAAASDARYILQAGAFKASGDAEALKARIALLGLSARVESGTVNGETVYRVRMGPYGTATELAEAKQKLGNGGLPALAIKAN